LVKNQRRGTRGHRRRHRREKVFRAEIKKRKEQKAGTASSERGLYLNTTKVRKELKRSIRRSHPFEMGRSWIISDTILKNWKDDPLNSIVPKRSLASVPR